MEECHEQYISSFDIYNYKTKLLVQQIVIDWRLCNIKVVDFPVKTFLACIRPFSFCYVHTCGGGREGGRVRIRKKKSERLIPSWGTTIKTPCQHVYIPKTLLPNSITLGVRVDKIQSIATMQICFYIKTDPDLILSFTLYWFFFWSILGTRWTFHKMYIMSIWSKIIGCEKIALLFPMKWTSYIQSLCKLPWFSKSNCLFKLYWKNVLICCTWLFSFKKK